MESRAVPPRRVRWRRNGTIAPRAVSSTAQIATRPNQRTLAPTPTTCPAPAAANHPSTSPTGIAWASALPPPGSGTAPWRVHPVGGAPAAARFSASSSAVADGALRPAAQATTRPGSHDTCSSTTPGSRSRASSSTRGFAVRALRPGGASRSARSASRSLRPARPVRAVGSSRRCPVRRAHASASRRRSDSRSAMTISRSSPRSDCARSRCSSASRRSASSELRHPTGSACSAASCSGVASPSTSASTYMSNCHGAIGVGVGVPVTDLRWIRRRARRAPSKNAGPRARPVPVAPCGGRKLETRLLRVHDDVGDVDRSDDVDGSIDGTTGPTIVRQFGGEDVTAADAYSAAGMRFSHRPGLVIGAPVRRNRTRWFHKTPPT